MELIKEWSIAWYAWLSQWGAMLSLPLMQFNDQVNIPILSALLLGILAALSPCQVSCNTAAMAYISRDVNERTRIIRNTLLFMLGKLSMYSIIGIAVIVLGIQMAGVTESIPLLLWIRKLLGPFFIITGLYFLGLIQFRFSLGMKLSQKWKQKVKSSNHWLAPFGLGSTLSLAFCPTLLWLFFGVLIPMGVGRTEGFVLPAIFALGTLLPLFIFVILLLTGSGEISRQSKERQRLFGKWTLKIAGVIFILVGLNDTFIYWFID
jgi:cytochrome c-type biogenesis protein